jgi:DNA-directed RNA polymerase specialized sigma24 family protein
MTKCIVCGTSATYWLCSNKCAKQYAKTRVGIECAICSFDPATGRMGDVTTDKLCDRCRAAEENRDWVDPHQKHDLDGQIDQRQPTMALGQWLEENRPRPGDLEKHVREYLSMTVTETVEKLDSKKRRRGSYTRERHYTPEEIAKLAGCTEQYVRKVMAAA